MYAITLTLLTDLYLIYLYICWTINKKIFFTLIMENTQIHDYIKHVT